MITAEIKEKRKHHIGSSDIAAIIGSHPQATAHDVWMNKYYGAEIPTTEAMETGNEFEPLIIKSLAEKFNLIVITETSLLYYECPFNKIFACNLDAKCVNEHAGIEVKYTTIPDGWGETGSELIPEHFLLQVQHQLMCTGFNYNYVGVWIHRSHGFDKRYFKIFRNEKMIKQIEIIGTAWWNKYVVGKIAPEMTLPPNSELAKSIKRIPEKVNDISAETWLGYEDAKKHLKEAEDEKKIAFQKVLDELGDAEAGRIIGSDTLFYYSEENAGFKIDFEKLKLKYPEAFTELVTEKKRLMPRERKYKDE